MRIYLQAVVICAALLAAVALLFVEINVPAVGLDEFGSAVRGSLGVSPEDLSLNHNLGKFSFLLNGGFALLSGAVACFAVANRRHEPMSGYDHWRSGDSATSI
jgi:hypothetical protein